MLQAAPKQLSFGAFVPADALWYSAGGLRVGAVHIVFDAGDRSAIVDRLVVMLAIAFRRRLPDWQLRHVLEAGELSRRGEQALANIRLALAGLSRVPGAEDFQKRAAMADMLLAYGMTAAELLTELGLETVDLSKFDPDQPRVPAGQGAESGRWTNGDQAGNSTTAFVPATMALRAAPLLAAELGTATLAALTALAASVGFAVVGGALFVPWQRDVSTSGPLPGPGGNSYSYNHDEGLLRVLDASGVVLAAGHKDRSGVFFDTDTGVPFARNLGGALHFDGETIGALRDDVIAAPRAHIDDNEPKLCPDPGPDQPGAEYASERAQEYQEQISRMINPQRPLDYGLAMNLINPVTGNIVHYDECDEKTGTMIEAKGPGFAKLLQVRPAAQKITKDWLRQASSQVAAAGTRRVEWYFAEQQAADYASTVFKKENEGRERIFIRVQPAEKQ